MKPYLFARLPPLVQGLRLFEFEIGQAQLDFKLRLNQILPGGSISRAFKIDR